MPPEKHDTPCVDLVRVQEQVRHLERTQERQGDKLAHLAGGMADYALAVKGLSGEHTELYRRIEGLEAEERCELEPDRVRALPQKVHDGERRLRELEAWRDETKERDLRIRGFRTMITVALISAGASLLVAIVAGIFAIWKG